MVWNFVIFLINGHIQTTWAIKRDLTGPGFQMYDKYFSYECMLGILQFKVSVWIKSLLFANFSNP